MNKILVAKELLAIAKLLQAGKQPFTQAVGKVMQEMRSKHPELADDKEVKQAWIHLVDVAEDMDGLIRD